MSQFANFYQIIAKILTSLYGKFIQWFNAVEKLPMLTPTQLDLLHGVSTDSTPSLPVSQQAEIESLLRQLIMGMRGSADCRSCYTYPVEVHKQRLAKAGFGHAKVWFQCFNFGSLIAIKTESRQ